MKINKIKLVDVLHRVRKDYKNNNFTSLSVLDSASKTWLREKIISMLLKDHRVDKEGIMIKWKESGLFWRADGRTNRSGVGEETVYFSVSFKYNLERIIKDEWSASWTFMSGNRVVQIKTDDLLNILLREQRENKIDNLFGV